MRDLWARIEALDNKVPASLQYEAPFRPAACCATPPTGCWRARSSCTSTPRWREFRAGVRSLEAQIPEALTGRSAARFEESRRRFAEAGLPPELAVRIASLEPLQRGARHRARSPPPTGVASPRRRACTSRSARARPRLAARAASRQLTVDGHLAGRRAQRPARRGLRGAAAPRRARCSRARCAAAAEARVDALDRRRLGKDLAHWQRTLREMRAAGAGRLRRRSRSAVESVRNLAQLGDQCRWQAKRPRCPAN